MTPPENLGTKLAFRAQVCAGLLALSTTAHAYRTAGDRSQFAGAGPVGWQQVAIEFAAAQPEGSLRC